MNGGRPQEWRASHPTQLSRSTRQFFDQFSYLLCMICRVDLGDDRQHRAVFLEQERGSGGTEEMPAIHRFLDD